jgi:serine/threonine protein kinase
MDVDDKTRFVFSGSNNHPSTPTSGSSIATSFGDDATVFVGDQPSCESQLNDVSHVSPTSGMFSRDQPSPVVDPDATVFAPSINPSHVTNVPQSQVGQAKNNDQIVIKQRFELSDLLGVGGMGAVYKAIDRRKLEANDSDPYVAIKVLNDDFRNHPDAFVSLQREARKSQTLAHPNIVNVHDFDRDNEMVFMTMEYLEGAPLDILLRNSAGIGIELKQAVNVLRDISNALIYAHSHNIVHSDFKPGNIFVTNNKGAKVFDFGIARAVKPGGIVANSKDDRTVFDAGSLGALTPAYASLEMLQGKDPAPSDDVYALGCVAYELFSGKHPFNKVPADKARQQGLSPKRLKGLSRRQWVAIKSALEFSREKRFATVDEFVAKFYGNTKLLRWLFLGAGLVSASAVGAAYMLTYNEQVVVEEEFKQELQQELEQELLQVRISDKKKSLMRLVSLKSLSESWEQDVRIELEEYTVLAPTDLNTAALVKQKMSAKFITEATSLLQRSRLDEAQTMLDRATRWEASQTEVSTLIDGVDKKREEARLRLEQQRVAAQTKARQLEQKRIKDRQVANERNREKKLGAALTAVENALHCNFGMDVSGTLASTLSRVAELDAGLAKRLAPDVAKELKACFQYLADSNPPRVEPLLLQAKQLLPNESDIAGFKLDYCSHLKPGSGSRGRRFVCQDRLDTGDKGPKLVVVKDNQGNKLAFSKYEISAKDVASFCNSSNSCNYLDQTSLPWTNISFEQAKSYTAWLSANTGHDYRIPTYQEWLVAASIAGEREDPDRNCHLKYGAIQKGGELVSAASGKANKYGLVNHVGNAQEWVSTTSGQLLAVGGSRLDQMSRCLVTTKTNHDGSADNVTGFRVVRNIF